LEAIRAAGADRNNAAWAESAGFGLFLIFREMSRHAFEQPAFSELKFSPATDI
jgi:hypothetical protein